MGHVPWGKCPVLGSRPSISVRLAKEFLLQHILSPTHTSRMCGRMGLPLIQRPNGVVEIWGQTGWGAGLASMDTLGRQAVMAQRVSGQPSWPCICMTQALGSWGLGQPPRRAPYGKCVWVFFFFRTSKQKKGKRKKKKDVKLRDRIMQGY